MILMLISLNSCFGWHCHAVRENCPGKALPFFEKDIALGRFQPGFAGNKYAGLRACLGDRSLAEKMVDDYYASASRIMGGSIFVGLCDYAFTGDFDYLIRMTEKEYCRGGPPGAHFRFIYAAILLLNGNNDAAYTSMQQSVFELDYASERAKVFLLGNIPYGQKLIDIFFTPSLLSMYREICIQEGITMTNKSGSTGHV